MKRITVTHENMNEWLMINGLHWQDLEEIAGKSSLYYYRKNQIPCPSEAIAIWADHFGWSPEQTWHLCFDGAPPEQHTDEKFTKEVLSRITSILNELTELNGGTDEH